MKADFVCRVQTDLVLKNTRKRWVMRQGRLRREQSATLVINGTPGITLEVGESIQIDLDFGGSDRSNGRVSKGFTVEYETDGSYKLVDRRRLEP